MSDAFGLQSVLQANHLRNNNFGIFCIFKRTFCTSSLSLLGSRPGVGLPQVMICCREWPRYSFHKQGLSFRAYRSKMFCSSKYFYSITKDI